MRILTIIGDLAIRGTQRAAQVFSLAYKRAGHDVAVLAYASDGPRRQVLSSCGIPIFVGGERLDQALETADRFAPDLLHIHRPGHANSNQAQILARLQKADRVVLETSVFGRVDYSAASRFIDVHLQISSFSLWRWLRRLGRKRRDQIGVLIPNPVETSNFGRSSDEDRAKLRRIWGIPVEAYVCGQVGYKSSNWAFDGFERLAVRDPSAWMVCVGELPEVDRCLQALPTPIRERVVRVPGTGNDHELTQIYSAFDCLLHAPTNGETFGYVVAEALLCGVPVVGLSRPHHDNGHLEVIGHREGGLIAGCGKHYADAVIEVRRDEDLRRRVREEGPERIRRLFGADAIADRAVRVAYHALAHRDRRRLRSALADDPALQTSVDDRTIMEMVADTLGGPSVQDLALMRLINCATGQRLVRLLKHRELLALRP